MLFSLWKVWIILFIERGKSPMQMKKIYDSLYIYIYIYIYIIKWKQQEQFFPSYTSITRNNAKCLYHLDTARLVSQVKLKVCRWFHHSSGSCGLDGMALTCSFLTKCMYFLIRVLFHLLQGRVWKVICFSKFFQWNNNWNSDMNFNSEACSV